MINQEVVGKGSADYFEITWCEWKNKKDRLDQVIDRLRGRKVAPVLTKLRQEQEIEDRQSGAYKECRVCGLQCKSAGGLKRHLRIHGKPYQALKSADTTSPAIPHPSPKPSSGNQHPNHEGDDGVAHFHDLQTPTIARPPIGLTSKLQAATLPTYCTPTCLCPSETASPPWNEQLAIRLLPIMADLL